MSAVASFPMSSSERQARSDLACVYRLFDHFGWHELIYNHITLRVPDEPRHFLINPFGLMYREVTASNLVKIDIDGNIVGESKFGVNPAGFIVHAAIHAARSDLHAVIHTHTTAGQVIACQEQGLLPMSFTSAFFYGRIGYHDFEGITLEREECGRLAKDLGDKKVMILRNHGLLTAGADLAEAFSLHYMLQRACEVQASVHDTGAKTLPISSELAEKAAAQFERAMKEGGESRLLFSAMRRWMLQKDPSYLN